MKALLAALLILMSTQTMAASDLILVPGFFSSAVPSPSQSGNPWKQPYFSQDIIKELTAMGFPVFVADNLSPVGNLAENGRRLVQFLTTHQMRRPGKSLILLGHSAGGLYCLYAAATSNLPIEQVISVTTPFHGLRFLETLEELHISVDTLVTRFQLKNISEFREDRVHDFLARLQFRHPFRMDVFAGYQRTSLKFWDYRTLSRAMIPFQFLTLEKSDGMVTVRSALGAEVLKEANPDLSLHIHLHPLPLEHWEYSLDANFSKAFQVTNISELRATQKQVYREIMRQAGH